jgi:hypothetical protein
MCTAFCGDEVRPSVVYFAEDGGDVNASDAYEPKCAAGCGLSGDGTTELYGMT